MGDFGDILDHFAAHMESLGYTPATETFDVTDVSAAKIDKAFCLLPGGASRSDLSIRHVDEKLEVHVAFKQPPRGVTAAKAISAARLGIAWHFLQPDNSGPADRIQWDGSEIVDLDDEILVLQLTFTVSYPGLMKPVNA